MHASLIDNAIGRPPKKMRLSTKRKAGIWSTNGDRSALAFLWQALGYWGDNRKKKPGLLHQGKEAGPVQQQIRYGPLDRSEQHQPNLSDTDTDDHIGECGFHKSDEGYLISLGLGNPHGNNIGGRANNRPVATETRT